MTISPSASPAGRCDSTSTMTPGSVRMRRRSMGNCAPASGRFQKFAAMVWRCGLWSSGSKLSMRQPVVTVVYDYAHSDERFVVRGDWLGPGSQAGAAKAATVFDPTPRCGAVAVESISRQSGGVDIHFRSLLALPGANA